MVLETNGIRQLERKQTWIMSTVILQILTAKQTSECELPATIKDMSIPMSTLICSFSDLTSVSMIVIEMIWARCLAGHLSPIPK